MFNSFKVMFVTVKLRLGCCNYLLTLSLITPCLQSDKRRLSGYEHARLSRGRVCLLRSDRTFFTPCVHITCITKIFICGKGSLISIRAFWLGDSFSKHHQRQTRPNRLPRTHSRRTKSPTKSDNMSHESVWMSRPRTYGKGARGW